MHYRRRQYNSGKNSGYGRANKQKKKGGRWILWTVPAVLLCILLGAGAFWFLAGPAGKNGAESFGPLPLGVPFAKAGVQAAAEVSGAGPEAEAAWQEMKIDRVLDSMTLEEKVNQLFMITPEALTGVGTVIDPLFSPASITSTTSERPLMIRLRAGKCQERGGVPGGYSDKMPPPCSSISI